MIRAGSVNISVLTEVWFVPVLSTDGEVAFCKYTYQCVCDMGELSPIHTLDYIKQ